MFFNNIPFELEKYVRIFEGKKIRPQVCLAIPYRPNYGQIKQYEKHA